MTFIFSCEPNTPETCATLETFRLFTIYIGNPVGLWFGQMVRKIQDWFHSESCLPFARITSLYLKAAESKMGFEQMVHKFPLGTFRPENRTALSDVPFAFQPDFPETFLLMVNNLKITFMEDDKRQFLQCDQFFPLHVVYCLFFIHFTVYYN